jgi:hypothetical protein
MVPRSDHGSGYYICHTRQMLGKEHCSQPTLRRDAVDGAIFEYFARIGLDVEATRAQLAADHAARLEEVDGS